MRRLMLAGALLAAAACAQAPGGAGAPSLDWRTSVRGEDLVVQLADPRGAYRVEDVALVSPSGRSYPAYELTRRVVRDDSGYGRPSVGVGGGFGSGGWSSSGVGVSIPLGGGVRARDDGAWTEARIALPPTPQAIGRDWKILVEVTDRLGGLRVAELPAPEVAR